MTYREHLIGFVKDEHLHRIGLQEAPLDHVMNASRSTDNNLRPVLESLHVITNTCATNAGMALNAHEITNSNDNLLDLLSKFACGSEDQSLTLLEVWVNLLEDGDRESGMLASS